MGLASENVQRPQAPPPLPLTALRSHVYRSLDHPREPHLHSLLDLLQRKRRLISNDLCQRENLQLVTAATPPPVTPTPMSTDKFKPRSAKNAQAGARSRDYRPRSKT